jgi:alpha-beta hydrolase superfamily lysophospholipase
MAERGPETRTFVASDGYPLHIALWPAQIETRGHVVVLHGVQSHGGWYHGLGRSLSSGGYTTSFPDRRGSGANRRDRGHTPSARRLIRDLAEWIHTLRNEQPGIPIAVAGISWGGKLAVILAARHPELVDAVALICPGLHPRVGVTVRERLGIAWAFFTHPRKLFPIPLSDPALFTDSPEGQAFIAADPLGLHHATAGLLAASFFIDHIVARTPPKVRQSALLMQAGRDRIIDNDLTLAFFKKLASADTQVIHYPEGHHTLEFDPDPDLYARDLVAWLDGHLARHESAGVEHHGTHQA